MNLRAALRARATNHALNVAPHREYRTNTIYTYDLDKPIKPQNGSKVIITVVSIIVRLATSIFNLPHHATLSQSFKTNQGKAAF
jgi:hypothetical protein